MKRSATGLPSGTVPKQPTTSGTNPTASRRLRNQQQQQKPSTSAAGVATGATGTVGAKKPAGQGKPIGAARGTEAGNVARSAGAANAAGVAPLGQMTHQELIEKVEDLQYQLGFFRGNAIEIVGNWRGYYNQVVKEKKRMTVEITKIKKSKELEDQLSKANQGEQSQRHRYGLQHICFGEYRQAATWSTLKKKPPSPTKATKS